MDLRYRQIIPLRQEKFLTAAQVNLGEKPAKSWGSGLLHLAEEACPAKNIRLIVDEFAQVTPDVLAYDMLCLAGTGKFTLSTVQINGLKGFIEDGGGIFMEACDETAAVSFGKIIDQIGAKLESVERGHPLLSRPYLFAQAPTGYEKSGELRISKGLIYSTFNYGSLWNGEAAGRTPGREEIRSAMEFGVNLMFNIMAGAA